MKGKSASGRINLLGIGAFLMASVEMELTFR